MEYIVGNFSLVLKATEWLNELAEEGWRVTSTSAVPTGGATSQIWIIMGREKPTASVDQILDGIVGTVQVARKPV